MDRESTRGFLDPMLPQSSSLIATTSAKKILTFSGFAQPTSPQSNRSGNQTHFVWKSKMDYPQRRYSQTSRSTVNK